MSSTSKHQVQPKDHFVLVLAAGVPAVDVAVADHTPVAHTPAAAEAPVEEVAAHNHVATYSAAVDHTAGVDLDFGLVEEKSIEIVVLLRVER
jgi:hypothetical protein